MRRSSHWLVGSTTTHAAAAIVQDCLAAIHRGCPSDALPQLDALKAQHSLVEGIDYARALCFLSPSGRANAFEARQSLLEELRLHPHHAPARRLLAEVNAQVRPLLLPPAEVQRQYPLFALLCDALLDSTMLSWPRLLHLYQATERLAVSDDAGHVVECGTAGGGSAVLMAVVLAEKEAGGAAPRRCVFALDTFTGMPTPSDHDGLLGSGVPVEGGTASWGTGTCRAPAEHVRRLARAFSVEDRLVVLPGLFATSIPEQLLPRDEVQRDGVALLHVDADWYASTRTALQLLLPVMRRGHRAGSEVGRSPSRRVQVDDYYYWAGCRRAVDECMQEWTSGGSAGLSLNPPLLEDVDGNAVSFVVDRDPAVDEKQ